MLWQIKLNPHPWNKYFILSKYKDVLRGGGGVLLLFTVALICEPCKSIRRLCCCYEKTFFPYIKNEIIKTSREFLFFITCTVFAYVLYIFASFFLCFWRKLLYFIYEGQAMYSVQALTLPKVSTFPINSIGFCVVQTIRLFLYFVICVPSLWKFSNKPIFKSANQALALFFGGRGWEQSFIWQIE